MMDGQKPRSDNAGQPPKPHNLPSTPEDRQLPEGRLRKELEKKKRCCANCLYATRPCGRWFRLILSQFSGLLICANSAEAPGELRGISPSSVCPNFRAKRPPTVQTVPPPPPADKAFYYIPLTQGQHAIVDAEDYERVSRCKWCLSRTGNQLYAQRRCRGKTIRMHQFIMSPPQGMVVDHIDGNGLNNRRGNLRICTPQQNAWNHKPRKEPDASSQYIGVYPCRRPPDKWYVKIQCGGEGTYLGPFDSEIEAARARDRKAIQLFGEYAGLNLPEEWPPERRAAVMAETRSRGRTRGLPDVEDVGHSQGNGGPRTNTTALDRVSISQNHDGHQHYSTKNAVFCRK